MCRASVLDFEGGGLHADVGHARCRHRRPRSSLRELVDLASQVRHRRCRRSEKVGLLHATVDELSQRRSRSPSPAKLPK